jgi:hypothetical protein
VVHNLEEFVLGKVQAIKTNQSITKCCNLIFLNEDKLSAHLNISHGKIVERLVSVVVVFLELLLVVAACCGNRYQHRDAKQSRVCANLQNCYFPSILPTNQHHQELGCQKNKL